MDNVPLQEKLTNPEPAAPEEQAAYDIIVDTAKQIMWGPKHDQIVKIMDDSALGHQKPWQAVGYVANLLVSMLADKAVQSGHTVNGDVLINAGAEVVENLMELGQANKLFQFDQDEYDQQQKYAMQEAVRLYAESQKGKEMDTEALAAEMSQLQAMEASGFDFSALDQPLQMQRARMNPAAEAVQETLAPPQPGLM